MERTNYMQSLMTATYSQVPIIAIQTGTIEKAWDKAIAELLKKQVAKGHSEAEVILQAAEGDYMKAAKLVLESEIPLPDEEEIEEMDDLPMDWEPDYDGHPRTQKPFGGHEPIEKPM